MKVTQFGLTKGLLSGFCPFVNISQPCLCGSEYSFESMPIKKSNDLTTILYFNEEQKNSKPILGPGHVKAVYHGENDLD